MKDISYILLALVYSALIFLSGVEIQKLKSTPKEIVEIYTETDVIYADFNNKKIFFEVSDNRLEFSTLEQMVDYIANYTADAANGDSPSPIVNVKNDKGEDTQIYYDPEQYIRIYNNPCKTKHCTGNLIWIDYRAKLLYFEDGDREEKFSSIQELNERLTKFY